MLSEAPELGGIMWRKPHVARVMRRTWALSLRSRDWEGNFWAAFILCEIVAYHDSTTIELLLATNIETNKDAAVEYRCQTQILYQDQAARRHSFETAIGAAQLLR